MMNVYELTEDEIFFLAEMFSVAAKYERRVRFAMDGGLKVKVGEGMWTAPLGFRESHHFPPVPESERDEMPPEQEIAEADEIAESEEEYRRERMADYKQNLQNR